MTIMIMTTMTGPYKPRLCPWTPLRRFQPQTQSQNPTFR